MSAAPATAHPPVHSESGQDWKSNLKLPPKDTRIKTEASPAWPLKCWSCRADGAESPPSLPPISPLVLVAQDVTATKGNSFEDYFLKRSAQCSSMSVERAYVLTQSALTCCDRL